MSIFYRRAVCSSVLLFVFLYSKNLRANAPVTQLAQEAGGAVSGANTIAMTSAADTGVSIADCFCVGSCPSPPWQKCAAIGMNVLATVGAIQSALANKKTEEAVKPDSGSSLSGLSGLGAAGAGAGGAAGIPPGSSATTDALGELSGLGSGSAPSQLAALCSKPNAGCEVVDGVANFSLQHSPDDILDKISEGIDLGNIDTGTQSKTEYLDELRTNLNEYENALAELNNLAAGRELNSDYINSPRTPSVSNVANSDSTSSDLLTQRALASSSLSDSLKRKVDSLVRENALDLDYRSLLRKRFGSKGPPKRRPVSISGLDVLNEEGRVLSLFERMRRALEGKSHRHLQLEHTEQMRKRSRWLARERALKRQKDKKIKAPDLEIRKLPISRKNLNLASEVQNSGFN